MTRNFLSRTTTAHSQSSTAAFANDASGLESGDVALQDMPRLSTETQKRNGYVQSRAVDRGARIVEDMKNGNYTCSICADTVVSENSQEYSVWHCRDCYNVFHLECIKSWATANGAASFTGSWKCALCSSMQDGHPRASCWCGKEAFNVHNMENPNACLNMCGRASQCPHGYPAENCGKLCHPGPCNAPCRANCPTSDAPDSGPPSPKQPSCWKRFHDRFGKRSPGTVSGLVGCAVVLAVIYALLAVFISYHIRWWSQPYRFPRFADKYGLSESLGVMFVGMFLVAPIVIILLLGLFSGLGKLLNDAFNLDSRLSKPGRKFAAQFLGAIFLGILAAGILALPIIGLAEGPNIAWYNQMRDSCAGYDTRISLDKWVGDGEYGMMEMPAQKLEIRTLSSRKTNSTMYLAGHLQPAYHSAAPFQNYYRLSGHTRYTPSMAVDVDIDNGVWRVLHLSNFDEANRFLAGQYEKGNRKVPPFIPVKENRAKNGTFNKVSSTRKHMDIPQLNLRIANMHGLIDACNQEPFLRVYRTKTLNETIWEDVKMTVGDDLWSSKYDSDIVMRTASFGHGRQRLDLCIKEEWDEAPTRLQEKNVKDDFYVPMAIITAHRLRIWEQGNRSMRCQKS